jgi:sugar O-acyltransferase (sialic acid O-acetyltransferase NeuD family)
VLTVEANGGAAERLVVVGAGGFGREVAWLVGVLGLDVVGFLDDRTPDGPALPAPLLGDLPSTLSVVPAGAAGAAARFVLAVGQPQVKQSALARLPGGVTFCSPLVHPSAVVAGAVVGAGSVIAPLAVVMVDSELGAHTLVNYGATVGHDVRMGAMCSVMPGARVSGFVRMGDRVLVGANAVVLDGLTIGDDVSIGAGAVVTRDVPDGATVVGVPARPVGG